METAPFGAVKVHPRLFGFGVLAGRDNGFDAHVRSQRKQGEQEAALKGFSVNDFSLRGGHKFVGEIAQNVGVFEHIEKIDGAPPALDFCLDLFQTRRLGLRFHSWHGDPRVAVTRCDPHTTARVVSYGLIECCERGSHSGQTTAASSWLVGKVWLDRLPMSQLGTRCVGGVGTNRRGRSKVQSSPQ